HVAADGRQALGLFADGTQLVAGGGVRLVAGLLAGGVDELAEVFSHACCPRCGFLCVREIQGPASSPSWLASPETKSEASSIPRETSSRTPSEPTSPVARSSPSPALLSVALRSRPVSVALAWVTRPKASSTCASSARSRWSIESRNSWRRPSMAWMATRAQYSTASVL